MVSRRRQTPKFWVKVQNLFYLATYVDFLAFLYYYDATVQCVSYNC